MADFLPARELNAAFYAEVIGPRMGDVPHSAAFLGYGSDVLGFDTERSTDHGWGPRLHLFLDEPSAAAEAIDGWIPDRFRGWPTRYGWDAVPVTHHVTVTTLSEFLGSHLGFDAREGVTVDDWLSTPQQLLLEVTEGAVFHDGLGELILVRETLRWYPHDVWLWLLACQWHRIAQEEPFVGRTAEVGDELGSRILAGRLARDVIRLCFLIEGRYAPYAKWLGTAFSRLDAAAEVGPSLERAVVATNHADREEALVAAYEAVARRFNALGLTEPEEPTVRLFHGRPFRVLQSDRFADACRAAISADDLRHRPQVGAVDQFVDSTDVLSSAAMSRRVSGTGGR